MRYSTALHLCALLFPLIALATRFLNLPRIFMEQATCRFIYGQHGLGVSRATVIAATVLLALPPVASADWLMAGYIGAVHTLSTTLHVRPDAGVAFDLPEVEFRGESRASPIYYGYRIGWLKKDSPWGLEAEFTHAKTIAVDTRSLELTAFEQSHGLNFVMGNVTRRSSPLCGSRCVLVGRAGAGFTIPHVEATYLGGAVSSYQYGGLAVQGGAGIEVTIHAGLTALVDGRVTYTRVTDDINNGQLYAPFTSWHADAGLGWRFH